MPNDDSLLVHNSGGGTMNVHGPIVGGRGNSVVTHTTAAAPPAPGAEALRLLQEIRRAAEAAADLPLRLQADVLTATAEAERCLEAAEPGFDRAALLLLRTRAALDELAPARGSAELLREMIAGALELLPG